MGLAVTNMRDEPTGAIPRGAGGYIPNYKGASIGRSYPSPQGKAHPGYTAPAQRDLLGPIFAVTAAMSALQGATSDAEKGLGKFTNITSKALGGMATAVFAGTALTGFATDMKASNSNLTKGFGKVLGPLSTFGMALGIAAAVVKAAGDIWDQASGVSDAASVALGNVAESAERAALKLDSLSPAAREGAKSRIKGGFKELITTTGTERQRAAIGVGKEKGLFSALTSIMQQGNITDRFTGKGGPFNLLGTVLGGDGSLGLSEQKVNFEGFDLFGSGQLEKSLEAAFEQASAAGAPFEKLAGLMEKIKEDGIITKQEVADTSIEMGLLSDKASDFVKALKESAGENLGLDPKILDDLSKISEKNLRQLKARGGIKTRGLSDEEKSIARDDVKTFGRVTRRLQEKQGGGVVKQVVDKQVDELLEARRKAQEKAEKDRVSALKKEERIASTIMQERLRVTIENIKLNKDIVHSLEDQIANAQAFGGLSEEELIRLQTKKALAERDIQDRTTTLDIVKKMVGLTSELTTKTDDSVALQNQLNLASRDGLINEDERLKIVELTQKVLEENTSEKTIQLEGLVKDIGLSKKALDIDKDRLKVARDRNIEKAKFLAGLELESAHALGISATRSIVGASEIEERIKARNLRIQERSDSPLNIRERRGVDRLNKADELENTRDRTRLDAMRRQESQRIEAAGIIDRMLKEDKNIDLDEGGRMVKGKVGKDLLDVLDTAMSKARVKAGGDISHPLTALAGEALNTREGFAAANQAALHAGASAEKLAKSALAAAGALDDLSFRQLIEDMETNLTAPQATAQRRIDRLLSTNPAERLKMGISEGNVAAKAAALAKRSEGGLIEFREILEQEEFSGKLIDASYEFAQNIGAAMVDAVARGEDLKGVLTSAATTFFNTLSQAYMSKAVDQIVGGGGGFLGSLFGARAGGGLITGGSGNRDDVPTLLTGGEFVIRKSAVEKYGAGFFEGLNTGGVGQMARGGLYSPGTYGQGAISGKRNLLDFATQSFTGGQFDQIGGGAGFGSASLEPQSAALTMFGRRNSPLFQREQQSKQQAFGLYTQQIQHEQQLKEQEKQQRKQLFGSIIAAAGAAAFSGLVNKMTTGNFAGMKPNPNQKGILKAGAVGGGAGGAANVFSGSAAGGSLHLPQIGGILDHHSSMINELVNSVMSFSREGKQHFRMDGRVFDENSQLVGGGGNGQVLPNRLERERQMNMVPIARQRAAGGYISPTAGVDTVPSMLSGGEFVMNAAATQRMGRGNLAALNSGGGGGGDDGAVVARLDELIAVTDGSGETVINITVNSDGTESQDTQGGQEDQHNLATKIKDVVRATIDEEKRLGGSLRRI